MPSPGFLSFTTPYWKLTKMNNLIYKQYQPVIQNNLTDRGTSLTEDASQRLHFTKDNRKKAEEENS